MIITDFKPFGLIKNKLSKKDKIGIVSCNSCVKKCETGGEEVMKQFELRLKKEELKGDTTIVLACDAGVYNLKKLFPKKKIISALDTIGLGAWDEKGNLTLVKKFK